MSKTILLHLLVDNDSAFRESVRDTLEIEGHKIIEAENGRYALSHLKKSHVDLVITDILMPEVEGNELSAKIRQLKPGLKIIGMTGGGKIGTADIVKSMCIPDYF